MVFQNAKPPTAAQEKRAAKAAKETTNMFKAMGSGDVSSGTASLTGLMVSLADATGILKPLEAVLDVIKGLFGIMGAQIVPIIVTAIRPLLDLLLSMTPVFIVIGQVIGILMQFGFIPLQIIIQLVSAVMTPLLPLIEQFGVVLVQLQPIIDVLVNVVIQALMNAIWAIGLPIAMLIDLFTGGIGAVDAWNDMMLNTTDTMVGLTASTLRYNESLNILGQSYESAIDSLAESGIEITETSVISATAVLQAATATSAAIEAIITATEEGTVVHVVGSGGGGRLVLQEGSSLITRTGQATVHAGEEVKPAGLVGRAEEILEDLVAETRKARLDVEFREAMRLL